MKTILNLLLAGMTAVSSAQTVPNLPIPIGAGTAEVWNESVYFFGGSNTWGGRDQLYKRVYKFDGTAWSYQDSIPDNNVWGIESVLAGNEVYLLGGWRSGASLLRKYDIGANSWVIDQFQINGGRTWMAAAAYQGGLYVVGGFDSSGSAVNVVEKIIPQGPVSSVKEKDRDPSAFSLSQNYPNPFNPSTTIPYSIAQPGTVQLGIHDVLGRHVRTLVSTWKAAGTYAVVWDGLDDAGRAVTSGSYFYRLSAGEFVQQRKLALVK